MKKLLSLTLLAIAVALPFALLPACGDEDTGIPCTVPQRSGDAGAGGIIVNSQSLMCRSRLCIYFPAASAQALCTRICSSEDDCPGANEIETCSTGFACIEAQSVGSLKCCKMCVCKKFIQGVDAGGSSSACQNFTPNCPEL